MKILVKKTKTRKVHNYSYSAKDKNKVVSPSVKRIRLLTVIFGLVTALIIFRLAQLQLVDGSYYYALANDQHEIFKQLYPERGTIYVQQKDITGETTLFPIATNRELNFIFAIPETIEDPEAAVEVLMEVLDFTDEIKGYKKQVAVTFSEELTEEQVLEEEGRLDQLAEDEAKDLFKVRLLEKLSKENDPYEPVKHRVSDDQVAQLEEYGLEGIRWVGENARYYPELSYGSHLVGFVGHSNENNMLKGYYGVEGNYNKILSGEAGFLRSESDGTGRVIALAGKEFQSSQDGSDIILTIDKAIQYYACEQLFFGVKNFDADSGSVIVMNPQTGAIIAMCSYPDFNPHEYNKVEEFNVFNNPALLSSYEPGSIFKPITMAAALDTGKITPFTGYNDTGVVHVSGYDIKNSDEKAHGWKTMTEVLEESLNTGTIFAARQAGQEVFAQYVKDFGFGKQTGIDLSPEALGNIVNVDDKNEIYLATSSFGQGLTVTPLQMVCSYAAIANDGKLVQPYVVDRIINPDGTEEVTRSKVVSQVISSQTSKQLSSMLVSVVENGHADYAKVPGYLVAGKTGTAQVPDLEKGGYSDQTIHSFIGFAPLDDPIFVMLVKLDNVKNVQYSASSAAPVFGKVSKFILDYYEITPSVK